LLRKSMHHFSPKNTVEWFAERGVVLKTEEDGRMFPVTDSSRTIVDCLLQGIQKAGMLIHYGKGLQKLEKTGEKWLLTFSGNYTVSARAVLLATGSASQGGIATMLEELGHTIHRPVPSLFTFNLPKHPITALMGLSVPAASVR